LSFALSIALCGAVQAQNNEKSVFDADGTWVDCYLVLKDASHLTGFASWDSGETVLNLTRKEVDE